MQAFVRDGRKLRWEDVYFVQAKRIRPDEKGYTFGPCNR